MTLISFTFNIQIVFCADCRKLEGHIQFSGCQIHDCFDPSSEFKLKHSIYEEIKCQNTSADALLGVMLEL